MCNFTHFKIFEFAIRAMRELIQNNSTGKRIVLSTTNKMYGIFKIQCDEGENVIHFYSNCQSHLNFKENLNVVGDGSKGSQLLT